MSILEAGSVVLTLVAASLGGVAARACLTAARLLRRERESRTYSLPETLTPMPAVQNSDDRFAEDARAALVYFKTRQLYERWLGSEDVQALRRRHEWRFAKYLEPEAQRSPEAQRRLPAQGDMPEESDGSGELLGRRDRAPRIAPPPGHWMLRLAEFLVTKRAREEVLMPVISDMRLEVFQAIEAGDRVREIMLRFTYGCSFLEALAVNLPPVKPLLDLVARLRAGGVPGGERRSTE